MGCTAVARACTASGVSASTVCDTLDVLLTSARDGRLAIQLSGLSADATMKAWRASGTAGLRQYVQESGLTRILESRVRHRMVLRLTAAAGVYAATTMAARVRDHHVDRVDLRPLYTDPMDEHVVTPGGAVVYIPDPLRAGGCVAFAACLAKHVDSALRHEAISSWVPLHRRSGSPTLRAWAWMRRVHALRRRR